MIGKKRWGKKNPLIVNFYIRIAHVLCHVHITSVKALFQNIVQVLCCQNNICAQSLCENLNGLLIDSTTVLLLSILLISGQNIHIYLVTFDMGDIFLIFSNRQSLRNHINDKVKGNTNIQVLQKVCRTGL